MVDIKPASTSRVDEVAAPPDRSGSAPQTVSSPSEGNVSDRSLRNTDFELIAESIPHIVWLAAPDGSTDYFNRLGTDYTGLEREANYDWAWVSLIHPDDADRAQRGWEHATRTRNRFTLEYRIRRADGEYRWHACEGLPVRNVDGSIARWVGTAIEIEEQRQLTENLERAQHETAAALTLLETLHADSPIGYGFVDRDLRLVRLNAALAAIGGGTAEEQLGRTIAEVVPALWPQLESVYRRVLDTGESVVNLEVSGPTKADVENIHHALASYYPVHVGGEIIGVGIVVVDITQRKEQEAFRAAVMDTIAEGLYALDADGRVTFMNASAIEMLGWTDDELQGRPMHASIHYQCADGSALPETNCELLKVRSQGRTIRVNDDAFTRKDGTIIPVAYSAAPLLNGTKVGGVVVVFRDTTEERADEERAQRELDSLAWVGRIREALDDDRFVLYTQPIISLQDNDVRDEELLIRMVGHNGEIILPGSFIPAAEKYGMISEIDSWVIAQAVQVAAVGRRAHVNISAQSIGPLNLIPMIERAILDTNADPANLVFEITETSLNRDIHAAERFAQGLADIGCGLSLDDFGTGFASFTYLKTLPLESLKIDIEFVRDLTSNEANQHIVEGIVQLAASFGYQTIAEGVEDDETLALLRHYGVGYAQGHLLGVPTPLAPTKHAIAAGWASPR